ncbi:MAG: UTP--glucose-1-phosphate uridylyltransferase GalU [Gammaproteobacteria bacterium]|nr:UTP--glucose-1-phosphate uridylyltransferase GalU [Gammaproteobacteria bacterium]MCH9744258.1 UTP--glucose-1-phosphate uridylyltransferase GalU [Gammaproteobacteria bacterium]
MTEAKAAITTAVFPVAGLGTRFLPVTKAGPKEMLPIVDKPIIQYAVEEALAAGIKQLIFVTSSSKRAIEDYFDSNYELESRLEERGKYDALSKVRNILPNDVSIVYVRQAAPLGLGHAVLCAKHIVGDQPFAVLLPDDIMFHEKDVCLRSMVEMYQQVDSSILAVEEIPYEDSKKYGVISVEQEQERYQKVKKIVEKPAPEKAPSNLAVTGRYILTPAIFSYLEKTQRGVGGEIQLTDAISDLLNTESVYAYPFNGSRFDCGSRIGFLQATITFALRRDDLRERLKEYLETVISEKTAL